MAVAFDTDSGFISRSLKKEKQRICHGSEDLGHVSCMGESITRSGLILHCFLVLNLGTSLSSEFSRKLTRDAGAALYGMRLFDDAKSPLLAAWVERFGALDAAKAVLPAVDRVVELAKMRQAQAAAPATAGGN